MLGSLMVLEKSAKPGANAVASWKGSDDAMFTLRRRDDCDPPISNGLENPGLSLIHQAGTASAVWDLGTAICKVKAWDERMELECNTIDYVKRHTSIPVPGAIHSWVDEPLSRSFLILEKVEGATLRQAWPFLSLMKRAKIANKVAQFCSSLATLQSDRLQSACGAAVLEPFLTADPPASAPS